MRKTLLIIGLVLLCLWPTNKVLALGGVGAKAQRNEGLNQIHVVVKHSPYSQIVVVDDVGKVWAGVLDTGVGTADFYFNVNDEKINSLKIFGIDKATHTTQISLPSGGLNNELLPPSITFNPQVPILENSLGVGGYSYPGASLKLSLSKNGQLIGTVVLVAENDGGWTHKYSDLEIGSYVAEISGTYNQKVSLGTGILSFEVDASSDLGDQVSKVVENIGKVLPPAVGEAVKNAAPQAEQINKVVAPVTGASLLTQLAFLSRDLLYWLFQAGVSLMQYFGFWRKRHPWGIVYDAVTKQPVMLATVRLYSIAKVQQLIETDVTSKAGVFSFFPKAGEYIIKASKIGYQFPSVLVRGGSDGEYARIYHGEKIRFEGEVGIVDVSVPLDPAEIQVSLRFKIERFIRGKIVSATMLMLIVGLAMAIVATLGGKGGINGLLLLFYLGILIVHLYLAYSKGKAWGTVVDDDGKPVAGVQLDLIDPKFEKLVQRRVTDAAGKYQFVVPEGSYVIRIDTMEHTFSTAKKSNYAGQEIVVRGDKPKLIALKLVVKRN